MSGEVKKHSELALRFTSGITLVIFALWLTWIGGAAFAYLCAVASLLVAFEYRRMATAAPRATAWASLALTGVTFVLWFAAGTGAAFNFAVAGFAVLAVTELAMRRSIWSAGGLAYAVLPFFGLVLLRHSGDSGIHAVLYVFAVVWGADIFAYFTGRTLGGPKLAPVISPNKTWSGFFGGIAGAVILSWAVALWFGLNFGIAATLFSIGLAIVSQIGDLFESWIKRRFGVKDSGAIVPGHGGAMDRLDGLIFAVIAAWVAGSLAGGKPLESGSVSGAFVSALFAP